MNNHAVQDSDYFSPPDYYDEPVDREISQLRVPPHSNEAESSVLGGLLLDNNAWDRVADLLVPGDFYRYEHQLVFEAIGKLIAKGANTFLRREYLVLARFVAVATVLIVVFLPSPIWGKNANPAENITMAIAYVAGAVISAAAGKIGIVTATKANVKSAESAVKDIRQSFLSGFRGGAVMGMAVVGASLLGVTLV